MPSLEVICGMILYDHSLYEGAGEESRGGNLSLPAGTCEPTLYY